MEQNLREYILQLTQQGASTPFYLYDLALLESNLKQLQQAPQQYGFKVHYALKANSNEKILHTISRYLSGADCVSGNEVLKAAASGFNPSEIVFAGVGKSDKEIDDALDCQIFCFNCESAQELEVIHERAALKNTTARIALRINPGVNAKTHHYITTGLEENKFGINMWQLEKVIEKLQSLDRLHLIGIHFHIGSQITDLQPFRTLCNRVNEIMAWFHNRNIHLEHINVGGGLGINYHEPDNFPVPDYESFFKIFHESLQLKPGQELHFELGRAVVAHCGNLISRVLYIKEGAKTKFAILDAGMTELIRPALYQSYHRIENLSKANNKHDEAYDVVGPVCESSDCFGKAVSLPPTHRGDVIAIRSAGAYGEVMASQYNLRRPVTVLIKS